MPKNRVKKQMTERKPVRFDGKWWASMDGIRVGPHKTKKDAQAWIDRRSE